MKRFKLFSGQKTFLGESQRLEKLKTLGDKLIKLKTNVNWEIFRKPMEDKIYRVSELGGRPPYDYIIMLKILILQRYNNLSDPEMEFQLNDRLSYQRFLDISLDDDIPDATTIAHFKEQLKEHSLIIPLFRLFLKELKEKGIIGNKVCMIDASFVEVPIQRNKKEENDQIKNNNVPSDWSKNKKQQKDTDARWTKKDNKSYFGYKNHIKADGKSKIILEYQVTPANRHDSQILEPLLEKEDKHKKLYADSAYKSDDIDQKLVKRKIKNMIIEKSYRNSPLTKSQIARNKKRSSVRVRVEHIFGFIENSMGGSFIRSIGVARAETNIGIMNLSYNIFRSLQIN